MEALASGKPVICVNEGGPLEYLNTKNSFLFNGINGLVEILRSTNEADFMKMRDDCSSTAKKFDVKAIVQRIEEDILSVKEEFY